MAYDSTIKNSTYNIKNGRYVKGGVTEVSSFALEWWEKKTIPQDPSDLLYVVEQKYEGKPHLLGLLFYGDTFLSWIIWQYNSIIDPMSELVEGKLIRVPLLDRINATLNKGNKPGGIASTRGGA